MRREVLQQAVKRIVSDLEESGLAQSFESAVENYQPAASPDARVDFVNIAVLSDYFKRVSVYGEAENAVMSIMGIESLANPSTWQPLLQKFEPSFVFNFHHKIRHVISFLPRVMNLLEREYFPFRNADLSREDGLEVQTVILSDEGDALSTPERIIVLLSSINSIYQVIAQTEGLPENSIALVGLDSGSEKSFDFLGLAKLMSELRETLNWAYNIIWFHKQNVTVKNLQVTGETLAIISKISKMEIDGQIDAEASARMKHGIYAGLEKFSSTGAYTPEMKVAPENPALAMRPQQKLLTSNPAAMVRDANDELVIDAVEATIADEQTSEDAIASQKLSREDIDKLLALLEKDRAGEQAPPQRRSVKARPRKRDDEQAG